MGYATLRTKVIEVDPRGSAAAWRAFHGGLLESRAARRRYHNHSTLTPGPGWASFAEPGAHGGGHGDPGDRAADGAGAHCLAKGASVNRIFAELLGKESGYRRGKGGEYTPWGDTIAGEILGQAKAFGIHAESVDAQDVQAVNATMRRLVERALQGEGPAFLECKTYRYYGHHVGDVNREFRAREEEREWMSQHDPLQTLAGRLTAHKLADAAVFERILTDVKAEIDNGRAARAGRALPGRERRRVRVTDLHGREMIEDFAIS